MALAVGAAPQAQAQTVSPFSTLFNFSNGLGGPNATLLAQDTYGDIFGLAYAVGYLPGSLYKFSPAAPGRAKPTVTDIYDFTAADLEPVFSVVPGPKGALYGATTAGSLYELDPPAAAGAAYRFKVIYNLALNNAALGAPTSLIAGPQGTLYGSAQGGVFQLTPPGPSCAPTGGNSWCLQVLSTQTMQGIAVDPSGDIFGVYRAPSSTSPAVVYELTPGPVCGGAWKLTQVYNYGAGYGFPVSPQVFTDSAGNVFGEILGIPMTGGMEGTSVFRLSPPAAAGQPWKSMFVYTFPVNFNGYIPSIAPQFGENGALYGAWSPSSGATPAVSITVFKLTPPASASASFVMTTLGTYAQSYGDINNAPVLLNPAGHLFGTTNFAVTNPTLGSVWEYR